MKHLLDGAVATAGAALNGTVSTTWAALDGAVSASWPFLDGAVATSWSALNSLHCEVGVGLVWKISDDCRSEVCGEVKLDLEDQSLVYIDFRRRCSVTSDLLEVYLFCIDQWLVTSENNIKVGLLSIVFMSTKT